MILALLYIFSACIIFPGEKSIFIISIFFAVAIIICGYIKIETENSIISYCLNIFWGIFSILFTLGNRLSFNWFLPVLEISNGIPWIANKGLPLCIAFPLILALTSFGGLCAVMQTYSMIQESGLRIFPYIIQKLITATVTSLFAYFYVLFIHQ